MAPALDDDAARAVEGTRETLGALLRTAQLRGQRVFVAFLIGLLLGVYSMREVVWPALKADLLAKGADVIAQTPFDVILLQVKIGLLVGVLFALPVLFYFARDALRERGILRDVPVSRWKAAVIALFSAVLFVGGALYAYYLFFPLMFRFLAQNAMQAEFEPFYSIIHWTQFILVLGLSFGLAAQLPLAMTALSYSGVVPYEAFRDNWKYAVVLIFGFGALFSPPDPFTQILWAAPLVALYGFSLYLSNLVVTAKRGSDQVRFTDAVRARWNVLAGALVLGFLAGYAAAVYELRLRANDLIASAGSSYRIPSVEAVLGAELSFEAASAVAGAAAALLVLVFAVLYVVYSAYDAAPDARGAARAGDPTAIDLDRLDAGGVRAAPPEAFADLSEDEALAHANRAVEDGDKAKARAILDRFDEAEAAAEEADAEGGEAAGADDSDPITSATADFADVFTEDETTEDDIGGYYHDIAFIVSSLRSRIFVVAAVFMAVLASTFYWLYTGGIGRIRADFLARLPRAVVADTPLNIVTLHPVEALVFEVKISTIFAAIVCVPLLAYFAWPAVEERGLLTGDRRVLLVWGGTVFGGLLAGIAVGYAYIAPAIISWLVFDAIQANMVILYRVKSFFWLVFLTTAGIGLLFDIPLTMLLFERAGHVSYRTLRDRWRGVALVAFVFASVVTPESIYTLFVIAVPIILFYWFGIGLVWVVTLGGRRSRPPSERESESETATP
jgi:sec-independent protein translocase protein TatC